MLLLKNPHQAPRRKTLSAAMSTFSPSGHHRPKKKTYHRVPDLDQAMSLHKKPSLLLHLHSLITSQPSRSLLLRDLEKHVGFIQKWNFLSLIQKHPSLFTISRRSRGPISVRLSDKALRISDFEPLARRLMEPILLRNISKLLMMSLDCRIPLEKIQLIRSDLGLPENFRELFIVKYPEMFSLQVIDGKEFVVLDRWDSSLAVTAREEGLDTRVSGDGHKMEPIFVRNMSKLLMMSVDRRIPLEKIELIRLDLGLPENFRELFIVKYSEIFSVKIGDGKEYVSLKSLDTRVSEQEFGKVLQRHVKSEHISAGASVDRQLMEPMLVRNISEVLVMFRDGRISLEKIELLRSELGLPENFRELFIVKYPKIFSVKIVDGKEYVNLKRWDSTMGVLKQEIDKPVRRDGNFGGPYSFKLKYAPGFRPNASYVKEVEKWQKMEFPSPYLSARRIDPLTPQARKRAVAVLHEVLSLTMEKRLSSFKLDAFHNEYQLPCRLLLCLVKNHGIFYITNKGERSTVILKEGYDGCHLAVKCPLLQFRDKFVSLIGRPCTNFDNQIAV